MSWDGWAGAIFKSSLSGEEERFYQFLGAPRDGDDPTGLIALNGVLFGTTLSGGDTSTCNGGNLGCGTIFRLTKSGAEKMLYSFDHEKTEGRYPQGRLTPVNGTLYGATSQGAKYNAGTIFSYKL